MRVDLEVARRFLEDLEQRHAPVLSMIREHPFVTEVREGRVPLEGLRVSLSPNTGICGVG